MSTRRVAASKTRKASDTYRPGRSQAEKKESHRKAAAAYYARHPEIKEKNRLSLQKRREATKAKRRQWDPPKKGKAAAPFSDRLSRRSSSFDLNLVADELLNGPIHFKDPRGAPTSEDEDSDFRRMDARHRVQTETSKRNASAESAPLTPTPDERVAIEVLAGMGGHIGGSQDSVLRMANLLSADGDAIERTQPPTSALPSGHPSSRVQSTLAAVVQLNEGPLTTPTVVEQRYWVRKTFGFWGQYLQYRQFNTIDEWRKQVSQLRVEDD
ncbi:hypothetical protein B0H13DRAFT_1894862 [Mycena leptocephala]|nr:hypothetical protein B0H13DRAFT_2349140 [Mycena leptocephala]KAJ7873672.1 hypothetical protein B0H13DRAFT_1894862 [Mycena leptocephala]